MAQASSLWLKQWQASILYYLCGRLISHACFFNLGGFGWEVGGTGLASDWDGLWLMWQRVWPNNNDGIWHNGHWNLGHGIKEHFTNFWWWFSEWWNDFPDQCFEPTSLNCRGTVHDWNCISWFCGHGFFRFPPKGGGAGRTFNASHISPTFPRGDGGNLPQNNSNISPTFPRGDGGNLQQNNSNISSRRWWEPPAKQLNQFLKTQNLGLFISMMAGLLRFISMQAGPHRKGERSHILKLTPARQGRGPRMHDNFDLFFLQWCWETSAGWFGREKVAQKGHTS